MPLANQCERACQVIFVSRINTQFAISIPMELSLFAHHALLPTGWAKNVRVQIAKDGTIAAVQTGQARTPGEATAAIAVPGMANLHCHAFQRAMAGFAERAGPGDDSFWTWRNTMYHLAQSIDPAALHAIAAMAYVEMLESGFTSVGEFHYLHHGPDGTPYDNSAEMSCQIQAAAGQTGIGLTLLPVFYVQSGFDGKALEPHQKRFGHSLDGFLELLSTITTQYPTINIGIAPHSLRAVSPTQLRELTSTFTGTFTKGPVHIHVAEQLLEVEECVANRGARPVRWLLDNCAVDENWCLVHATHMDETEIRDVAKSGAVAGLCPITEANLGDGLFPASAFLQQNGRIGIGSDSCVRIGLAEELRLLDYGQRLLTQTRTPLAAPNTSSGASLFLKTLNGGAQALGQQAGALNVGNRADIVTLDANHPALAARMEDDWLDGWVYAAATSPVEHVYVAGRQIVTNGKHIERENIVRSFAHTLTRIVP